MERLLLSRHDTYRWCLCWCCSWIYDTRCEEVAVRIELPVVSSRVAGQHEGRRDRNSVRRECILNNAIPVGDSKHTLCRWHLRVAHLDRLSFGLVSPESDGVFRVRVVPALVAVTSLDVPASVRPVTAAVSVILDEDDPESTISDCVCSGKIERSWDFVSKEGNEKWHDFT